MLGVLDTPIKASGESLKKVLATRHPVMVVFEKPGCEPCLALWPTLEELSQEFIDRVRVVRVEDTDRATASRYGVLAVPTLVFWRHGRELARVEGRPEADVLRSYVWFLLGDAPRPAPAEGPREVLGGPAEASPLPTSEKGRPVAVTDASFEGLVLSSPLPVLVDFWAVWCPPCRAMEPVVEELAREYAGRLRVAKVNTDESPGWPGRLGIMGIPTFILFKDGREAGRIVGAARKAALENAVDSLLGAS